MTISVEPPPYLNGRYRLVQQVGQGGMGILFRARDERLQRDVAIKFLRPDKIKNSDGFLREARVVAQLNHAHIMTLHDVDQAKGWHYLVLEYLSGQNLYQQMQGQTQPYSPAAALKLLLPVLRALAYAHSKGIIHRDVKPENIMITANGRIKVTDFGLALLQSDTRLTAANQLMGTVHYLAPECITGGTADERSDLYAVGVLLYELLTGTHPYSQETAVATLIDALNKPVPPPRTKNPALAEELEAIVLKMMARDANGRYQTAAAALDALTPFAGEITAAATESTPSLLARMIRHRSTQPEATAPRLVPELVAYAAAQETTTVLENERAQLAAQLEDEIIEPLQLLLAQLQIYESSLSSQPQARMALNVLATLSRQVLQQGRDLAGNLQPTLLASLGLEPALENLATQEMRRAGLQMTLQLARLPQRLPTLLELALFRATQEALRQARQQRATAVTIQLRQQEETLHYSLQHNGAPAAGSLLSPGIQQQLQQLDGDIQFDQAAQQLTVRVRLYTQVQLTPRERQVMHYLVDGLSNKEIAVALGVKPRTINFHLDNIYAKLGVNSRTEAAVFALRQGWIRSDPNDPG